MTGFCRPSPQGSGQEGGAPMQKRYLESYEQLIERLRIAALIQTSRARRQDRATQAERFRVLETELGRVGLLAFALAELCLDKRLVTMEELDARLKALDAADG